MQSQSSAKNESISFLGSDNYIPTHALRGRLMIKSSAQNSPRRDRFLREYRKKRARDFMDPIGFFDASQELPKISDDSQHDISKTRSNFKSSNLGQRLNQQLNRLIVQTMTKEPTTYRDVQAKTNNLKTTKPLQPRTNVFLKSLKKIANKAAEKKQSYTPRESVSYEQKRRFTADKKLNLSVTFNKKVAPIVRVHLIPHHYVPKSTINQRSFSMT